MTEEIQKMRKEVDALEMKHNLISMKLKENANTLTLSEIMRYKTEIKNILDAKREILGEIDKLQPTLF